MFTFHRLRIVLATATVVISALAPASTHAGVLAADAANCDSQAFSQPFTPWGDPASYTLAPGGAFEAGSPSWDLGSGSDVVAGNEPWHVTARTDRRSLVIGSGSSATSPSICVGIQHPDIRFFAQPSSPYAALEVEVLYLDGAGNQQSLTIGTLSGYSGWALSPQMPIIANLLPLLPGSKTPVAFRLSAAGGSWNVDDFYVDPFARW